MFFKNKNTEIAHYLFAKMSVGKSIPQKYEARVMDIFNSCNSRQEVLNKIIELCSPGDTPEKRFLIAKAYAWSTAPYRKQAIKAIHEYLNNGLYEEEYINSHHYFPWIGQVDEEKFHISEMRFELGKAYEGEYMFLEAFNEYSSANKLIPYVYAYISAACNILIKMNDLNAALTYCEEFKKSPYYRLMKYSTPDGEEHFNSDFYDGINKKLEDIKEKINNGYVYKPRKKNS